MAFGCRNTELRESTNNSCTRLLSPGVKCMNSAVRKLCFPSFRQVTTLDLSHTGESKTDFTSVAVGPKGDNKDQAPGR